MSVLTQTLPTDAPSGPATEPTTLVDDEPPSNTMRCPDPSAHQTKSTALQDQASAAALTKSAQGEHAPAHAPLGSDGKLSSAGAATSLKFARAQDLPGFPVVGIDSKQSAGTAASLAHANQKTPEWWKPEQSTAAGKAALLAHHVKMEPVWRPEASETGSKAALLAHKDGTKSTSWSPAASMDGNSAANLAMKKQGPPPSSKNIAAKNVSRKNSLAAATGAASSARRKRAQSTPTPSALLPASSVRSQHALSAATLAHSPSIKVKPSPTIVQSNRLSSPAMEAARIQHAKVSRDMYTEHPPVALEVEEKNHQNALRASAISMAKQMYDSQEKRRHSDAAGRSAAAAAANESKHRIDEGDIKEQAKRYLYVQEAAQKLAAERLAKLDANENDGFRSYYGYESSTKSRLRRFSRRGRASSNPEPVDSDDEFQSRRIRSQMSQLNRNLAQVDAKKEQDRRALLAVAERKVQAQMLGMDEKIFNETGKMSPAMIEEWDAKARAKAVENSETRMANHGKVNIGGGRFVDQSDVDAVAAARIQPTLDEIAEKVEKQKAREEEERLDREEEKRQAQIERERAAEIKTEEKRFREEEKKAKSQHKAAVKQEKEAEKAKRAEEKRLKKEESHKSKEGEEEVNKEEILEENPSSPIPLPDATSGADDEDDDLYRRPEPIRTPASQPPPREPALASSPTSPPTSPTSPTKSSFKNFLHKFRRRSRHSAGAAEAEQPGFIARLSRRGSSPSIHGSQPQSPNADVNTFRAQNSNRNTYSDVSSISSVGSDKEGRKRLARRTITGASTRTGNTEVEEARDGFDETLAPSPNFTTSDAGAARIGSPTRESRFREVGL